MNPNRTIALVPASLLAVVMAGCTVDPPPPMPDAGADLSVAPELDAATVELDAGDTADLASPACVARPSPPSGRWTTGDLHSHTIESNDAQVALGRVLDEALAKNKLDWIALSNHLRVSNRDHEGTTIASGPVPMSRGVALYEQPAVVARQAAGLDLDRTIFSSVEWDMPTHDHMNVGIVSSAPQSQEVIHALNEFEYRFTNRDVSMFDPADVARWGTDRGSSTHADVLA